MEKRAVRRFPASINVNFYCCNSVYSGTVKNVSENGMFISTREMRFPSDSRFDIVFEVNEKKFHVPVKLVRLITSPDYHDGFAVEVSNPPDEYIELLDSFRSTY